VDKVNRELARLDTELRAGGIDRATFRAQRRRLLLDFEERETTTQPSTVTPGPFPEAQAETVVDADAELFLPAPTDLPPLDPAPAAPAPKKEKKPVAGIVLYALGVLIVVGLAGWWISRPKSDAPASLPATPTAAGTQKNAAIVGALTPQSLAAALIESQWSDEDLARFLDGWKQLPPQAIHAASEDSRIWLLRGETGRRLREAREVESLEPSAELRARIERLELVQSAIGTP
jgi:hypothetical protein